VNLVHRKLLMGALVAAFGVQTALVYADDTAERLAPLSAEAVRGRRLWHEHNCQSCHQIHGFGGFLGPDLTNAGDRLTDERLQEVLTVGNAQMPAFHFTDAQVADVKAFLVELSAMGVGVPRIVVPLDVAEVRAALADRLAQPGVPDDVAHGGGLFQALCTACHVPLQATPLGLQTAPDLTTVLERLDEAQVRATIADGRPERGMQAWGHLGDDNVAALAAFVLWLNSERDALLDAVGGPPGAQPTPWWEYR